MQYLLKLTLNQTELWRLIAIDGSADRAHVAQLCVLSFGYGENLSCSFTLDGQTYSSGQGGQPQQIDELKPFDDFKLEEGDRGLFTVHLTEGELVHTLQIMKCAEHLYCLMPSCLVGQGAVPSQQELCASALQEHFEAQEEGQSLDLREVTNRLRSFGAKRADLNEALLSLSAQPLQFKLLQ